MLFLDWILICDLMAYLIVAHLASKSGADMGLGVRFLALGQR